MKIGVVNIFYMGAGDGTEKAFITEDAAEKYVQDHGGYKYYSISELELEVENVK